MTLRIKIKHSGNRNKSGKMTVISDEGNTILSKVSVAIPKNVFDGHKEAKIISLDINDNLINPIEQLSVRQKNYEDFFNRITSNQRYENLIIVDGAIGITYSRSMILHNDDTAFVLHKEDFKKLSQILKVNEKFILEIKKSAFLFFSEEVNTHSESNVNKEFQEFIEVRDKLKKELISYDSFLKKQKKKLKETKKNKFNNQTKDNDPLLDLWYFYNPELSLIFHPHSTLAWFLYFNDSLNINQSNINSNIHEISGFENVNSCILNNENNGYTALLFSDEKMENKIGTIKFNENTNSYTLETNNGEKNILKSSEDGKLEICFVSEEGGSINIDLVQENDNFVGKWHSDNASADISSEIIIDNNFNIESMLSNNLSKEKINSSNYTEPNDTIFTSEATVQDILNIGSSSDGISEQASLEINDNQEMSSASDTSSWQSLDPYSN